MSAVLPFPAAPSSALMERLEEEPGAALRFLQCHIERAETEIRSAMDTPASTDRFVVTHLLPLLVDIAKLRKAMTPRLTGKARDMYRLRYWFHAESHDGEAQVLITAIRRMDRPEDTIYLHTETHRKAKQNAREGFHHIKRAVACLRQLHNLTEKEDAS